MHAVTRVRSDFHAEHSAPHHTASEEKGVPPRGARVVHSQLLKTSVAPPSFVHEPS